MNERKDPHISHQRREDLIQEVETQRLMKAPCIRRRERAWRRQINAAMVARFATWRLVGSGRGGTTWNRPAAAWEASHER